MAEFISSLDPSSLDSRPAIKEIGRIPSMTCKADVGEVQLAPEILSKNFLWMEFRILHCLADRGLANAAAPRRTILSTTVG
ncbi:hypothetical protein AVEN_114425-1 [Araneus ventricosus]|uniref:Uncharacterized protein n=1 Tax=Araneus ventricosus TaxID=182803 RepID=A0A4Y2QMF2_ARAVE|nr:hypothetical protein AVEN_114425-1 [Araneus ventricosus]